MVGTVGDLAARLGVTTDKLLVACQNLGFDVVDADSEIDFDAFNEAVERRKAESGTTPQWAPDPTGRHELRFWNGTTWSEHVTDAGVPGLDPVRQPRVTRIESTEAETAVSNPVPPSTVTKKRPHERRWVQVVAGVGVVMVVAASFLPDDTDTKRNQTALNASEVEAAVVDATNSTTTEAQPVTTAPPETTPPPTSPPVTTPRTTAARKPSSNARAGETVAQSNARRSAASYLSYTAFSRVGLIKQLEYEGFSTSDATYGVDAQNADWFAQAAKSARSYMSYSSFSRQSLIAQLEYEGFSRAEAEYGADSVGF